MASTNLDNMSCFLSGKGHLKSRVVQVGFFECFQILNVHYLDHNCDYYHVGAERMNLGAVLVGNDVTSSGPENKFSSLFKFVPN